jgi:lipopolysaccharide biosynthesis glycosyltransferase
LASSGLPIALCCSGALLPGLHATLASLVRHLGEREKISLHLFISDIDEASRADLTATVADAGGVGALVFHDPDLSDFKDLGGLHGDHMTYLRLKLPDLLADAATILYLDADLVVHTDAGAMLALPLGDAPLGAISGESVAWSLDHDIFRKVGLADEDRCFNAGVLLINAAWWRRNGVLARALDFARKNPGLLRSHDQTLLNIFFSRSFCHLPPRFNRIVSAETRPTEPDDGIYHFMGSPKPWDPLGFLMHSNWRLWKQAVAPSRFRWSGFLRHYGRFYLRRAWSLRYSYLRVLRRKWAARQDDPG